MTVPEEGAHLGECGECGSQRCEYVVADYTVAYKCPDCGNDGSDAFEDLYGCMSVPWGFLL